MRHIIAALQVSVDGFIEGPQGELDWVDSWEDPFNLSDQIDACILGRGMYAGYEHYWRAIVDNPTKVLSFTGKVATPGEIRYARFADRTPHYVLSTTLQSLEWQAARIVRTVDDVRRLKQQPGRDIYAVGGATLVGSLMNADLIDELRVVVHPIVLGGGKALFKDVDQRHALQLIKATQIGSGRVELDYRRQRVAA
jgi:dihydrofolate reductase